MDSKDILQSITESFFSNDNQKIVYLSLSERLMNLVNELLEDDITVLDLNNNFTPLKPFVQLISMQKPDDELLFNLTYSLQRESIISYFKNGYSDERKDPVIREEIYYEKKRVRETIIELLKKSVKGKYVILNSQLLSRESLEIIKSLNPDEINAKIVFCINGLRLEESPEYIREFMQSLSNKNNYYSINSAEDFESYELSKKDRLNLSSEELIHCLRSYRSFLAVSEGYKLVKRIETDSVLRNFEKKESRSVYMEMGLVCYLKDDIDLANYYFSNVTEEGDNDELEANATYYLANVSYIKNMNTLAYRYVKQNKQLLKNKQETPLYALTCMMEYIIMERISSEYSVEQYMNVLELLEKAGLLNNKIYASLVIPWSVVYQKQLREQLFGKIQEAYMQAAQMDNLFGLSTACHWMGICMAHDGRKVDALEWYNRCRLLREEIGETSAIIKITNGLSYEYLNNSDYQKSYDLINGFISHLLKSDDYPEIIITLGNIGRALFFGRNFKLAYDVFQSALNFLYIFELQDIFFNSFIPEYNDIMTYKAVIDFFNGEYTRAKMNLHNISNNGKFFTPIEKILKYFLKACLQIEEKQIEEGVKTFESGIADFTAVGNTQEHRLCFMYFEFAIILKNAGRNDLSEEYKKRGFKLAEDKGLRYYTQGKSDITLQEYLNNVKEFEPLKLSLAELEAHGEKERLMNQLHKRLRDSQFLNKLLSFSMDIYSEEKYISNATQAIFDYTMADAVFIAEKEDRKWHQLSSSVRCEIDDPDTSLWSEMLKLTSNVSPDHIKKEKDCDIMFINLSKFEFTGGMIIYLQKKLWLSAEEMNTLNLAINSVQSQLVMFRQNQFLTKISSTDQLSQLKNRYALQEHLAIETELLSRYEQKHHGVMYESIAFVDLDNFKYYNDTFGHEVGDLLISCMGRILNEIFRTVDFVARYGGDEFVVCLPNTTCDEARRSGERLYKSLEKAKYFVPAIERLLGRNIKVPKDKRFGFSIGISCTTCNNDPSDLEETLVDADQALYYSKHHKKGTISIWSEVKDKIESNAVAETSIVKDMH